MQAEFQHVFHIRYGGFVDHLVEKFYGRFVYHARIEVDAVCEHLGCFRQRGDLLDRNGVADSCMSACPDSHHRNVGSDIVQFLPGRIALFSFEVLVVPPSTVDPGTIRMIFPVIT